MTDTTHADVIRLAQVRDEELTGFPASAAAQALLKHVMTEPVPAPARSTRFRPARRLVLATAAAALAVTATVVAGPSLIEDGTGAATSYANSAIAIDLENGYYVARIKDPLADHARYAEAFRAVGLDVDIDLLPVSPAIVGQLLLTVTPADNDGNTVMTEVVSTGPEPVDCARQPAGCMIVIRIAADATGSMRFAVGRAAQPGEAYAAWD